MDLVAALATIEQQARRRPGAFPLGLVAAVALVVGTRSGAVAGVAALALLLVAVDMVFRVRGSHALRDRRVAGAVQAYLQLEHGLVSQGRVDVHPHGARLAAVDAWGAVHAVEVLWTPLPVLDDGMAVPIAGPVEVRASELVEA